ncbi:MAG TPA: FtsX-like permease family protein [Solirubrobacteraceae bacterium]|nr:FtsX-like permease family protein [Solirubrobacteraceae bacterium]
MSSILRLYRARLRARVVLVQELFAVLGLAVGVALLFASLVASASLNDSVRQFTSGVVGQSRLQLLARDSRGFDEALLVKVQHLPGVLAAVPVLEQRANLVGPSGEEPVDVIASDPRYAHLAGPLLRNFSASQLAGQHALALPGAVAAKVGVQPLQTVTLQLGARAQQVLVGADLSEAEIGALVHSPIALAPLAFLQRLAGMPGRITRILVQPRAGHDGEVRAGLLALARGRLNVEPADFDATLFSQAAGPIDQSMSTFSAIGALVGFMFAYCAMLLTVPLRRGLIRDLRRDGATRWMTVKTLLFDAVALGVLASVLGLALGELLSLTLLHSNPGYLAFAFPVGSQRIVTWQSIVLAAGAGLLAAGIGVLTPLREIFSRPLRGAAGASRAFGRVGGTVEGLAGGLLCLALTTLILVLAPQSAVLGIVILIVGLMLFLAPLLRGVVGAFDRFQRQLTSGAARLAVVELRSPATQARSLAIAATGAIAVFAGVTIQGATENLQRGLDRLFHNVTAVADIWVVPPGGQNLLATTPFPDAASAKLSHLRGVRAVGLYRAGFLTYGNRRLWVLAPPAAGGAPIPANQLLGGGAGLAAARLRAGGWAVLSKSVATQQHLRVGDLFTLPAPSPTRFRVAALSTNLGWPPGAIVLGSRDYVRAWGSTDPSAYNVILAPGASAVGISGEIRRALGPASGLVVETAHERELRQRSASRRGLERLSQIALMVLIAGVLAISVAMSAMISQRRPQLARMKLEGFPRRGLWRALVLESGLLLGVGCSSGALLGVYGQLLLSHALLAVTGFPVVFSVGALAAIGSFVLVTATAAAIIAVPGYRAASVRPHPAT